MSDSVLRARTPNAGSAWAWVGIVLSVALNVLAGWMVIELVNRPDVPLLPPPACVAGK